MKLLLNTAVKFISGLLMVGFLLFLPAGTLKYMNAWLFIALLFIPMMLLGLALFIKSPKLLKKRLNSKEKESTQKGVIAFSGIIFTVGFIVAGLDFRFCWSSVPKAVVAVASMLFLVAYGLYAEVIRENAYLSRTVEIQENQKVIDTGLYSIVRHPMYSATTLLYLVMPVVLGSWFSLIVFAFYPVIIVVRICNEEQVLEQGLEGYTEYKTRVKYKIIPFIW